MKAQLQKLPIRILGQYERLDEELKHDIAKKYERHERACRVCEVKPDPNFLVELINELAAGRRTMTPDDAADAIDELDAAGIEI